MGGDQTLGLIGDVVSQVLLAEGLGRLREQVHFDAAEVGLVGLDAASGNMDGPRQERANRPWGGLLAGLQREADEFSFGAGTGQQRPV